MTSSGGCVVKERDGGKRGKRRLEIEYEGRRKEKE